VTRKKNKSVISQGFGATDILRRFLSRKENDGQEPIKLLECLEKFKKFNRDKPC